MEKSTIERLKRKGWTSEEITKASNIIDQRKIHDKSKTFVFSQHAVYWGLVFVIFLGNFLISLSLIPFLLVLDTISLDIIIVVLGFGFGSLFTLVLLDLKTVARGHIIVASLLIPLLALVNFYMMVTIANAINNVLNLGGTPDHPIRIAVIYLVAFVIPYLYAIFVKKRFAKPYAHKAMYSQKDTEKEFLRKY